MSAPLLLRRLRSFTCLLVLAVCACHRPAPAGAPAEPAKSPSAAPASTAPEAPPAPENPGTEAPTASAAAPGVAIGTHGAVSSAEGAASDVGVEILKKGGNAVDAAVAVGFALGVTHPAAGNMGGGGFMVVRFPDGTSTAIDYRETAPRAANRDMYLDASGQVTKDGRIGPRAAGIPGVVAGLAMAHKKYGKLPWADVLAPAVALARDGSKLDSFHADDMKGALARIGDYAKDPAAKNSQLQAALRATLADFGKPDGSAYSEGEIWKQPDLARTLEAIAKNGPDAFYRGAFAADMASKVKAMGGIWSAEDLASYKAIVREPIKFSYRGYDIVTMPPPSAGGVVLRQILAAAEYLQMYKLDWDSTARIHLYVESLRRTYADRNELIGDPDFVKIPLSELLDTRYVAKRMAGIDPKHATPSSEIKAGLQLKESEHTTHFSVVDSSGMAVANTYTLNGGFGAKVVVPGTGVILNNEMDDFTSKVGAPNMFGLVQGPQNGIEPGKRMLSSMTPTILVKDGKLRAVIGSPGGPTITTTVAQIVMQLIDHNRSLQQAVAAPRVHHQWLPDQIWHESSLPSTTVAELQALGHKLVGRDRIGHANCIEIDPKSSAVIAVADVMRDGGKASAY
ncbi:MAG TPA: gamma-glutamyltransferase [Polyangiaceae bacterium]|nr:gamma-glutamyltransferase [Polyangiaceae bacterium]